VGIGPVQLGDSLTSVLQNPTTNSSSNDLDWCPVVFGDLGGTPLVAAKAWDSAGMNVDALFLFNWEGGEPTSTPTTSAGVGMGSTRAQVEQGHPNGVWADLDPDHEFELSAKYVTSLDTTTLTFGFRDDRVTAISLGPGTVFPYEFCG